MQRAEEIYQELLEEFEKGAPNSELNLACQTRKDVAIYAMKIFANQQLDQASDLVVQFDTLVDTYDCINPRNEDVSNAILKLKT